MKFNYLAVIVPVKWLPQNTEQARTQMWGQVTQLLLPNLGKWYSRFYPASTPWGQDIQAPFGVVLGREEPVKFLNLFYRAKRKQDDAVAFHTVGLLSNADLEQAQKIGDTLVCHVTAAAIQSGSFLPDCGIYYLEQKQAVINPEQERAVSGHPADYALCAVTLENMEETK